MTPKPITSQKRFGSMNFLSRRGARVLLAVAGVILGLLVVLGVLIKSYGEAVRFPKIGPDLSGR